MFRTIGNLLQRRKHVKTEAIDYNQTLFILANLDPDSQINVHFSYSAYAGLESKSEHSKGISPRSAIEHLGKYYKTSDDCTISHDVFKDRKGLEKHYLSVTAQPLADSIVVLTSRLEYMISAAKA